MVDGEAIAVYKDPITDPGKKSKRGRLVLLKTEMGYETVAATPENQTLDRLEVVYENGKVMKEYTLDEVRQRAWSF